MLRENSLGTMASKPLASFLAGVLTTACVSRVEHHEQTPDDSYHGNLTIEVIPDEEILDSGFDPHDIRLRCGEALEVQFCFDSPFPGSPIGEHELCEWSNLNIPLVWREDSENGYWFFDSNQDLPPGEYICETMVPGSDEYKFRLPGDNYPYDYYETGVQGGDPTYISLEFSRK